MGQSSMNLRGKFVSGTFAGRCNSASVHKNGGFVNPLVDLAVGGVDLALETPEKVRVPFSPRFMAIGNGAALISVIGTNARLASFSRLVNLPSKLFLA